MQNEELVQKAIEQTFGKEDRFRTVKEYLYQVKDGKVASDTLNGSNSKSNGGSLEDLTRDMTDRGFAIQQKQPSCISLGFAAKINQ